MGCGGDGWLGIAAESLEGVFRLGRVEFLEQIDVASWLAAVNWATGKAYFPGGMPDVIAISRACMSFKCLLRFRGEERTQAAVEEWAVGTVLRTPPIPVSPHAQLDKEFYRRSPAHKVNGGMHVRACARVRVFPLLLPLVSTLPPLTLRTPPHAPR
eukprot:jgi/Mesen1/6850/ME000351S05965